MLAEKQLIEWFHANGIDLGVPFPTPLIGRLFRKALILDQTLFVLLGKSFTPYDKNKNLLVLKFSNWNEMFLCYTSYGATFTISAS